MIYLRLFYEFFKTGLFAIGGGMATFPFLSEMADKTGWFTQGQLADMVAISESTPGPIGVNMASYVGYVTGGVPGVLAATLGLICPSVIIILVIAGFLKAFRRNQSVQDVFYGLRPASVALIASAGLSVILLALVDMQQYGQTGRISDLLDWKSLLLAALLWVLTNRCKPTKKLHPVVFIALSAAVGVLFRFAGA